MTNFRRILFRKGKMKVNRLDLKPTTSKKFFFPGEGEVFFDTGSRPKNYPAKEAENAITCSRSILAARVKTGNGFSVSVNLPLTLATRLRYRERYISSPLRLCRSAIFIIFVSESFERVARNSPFILDTLLIKRSLSRNIGRTIV